MVISLLRGCDTDVCVGVAGEPDAALANFAEVLDAERMFGEHVCGERSFAK